MSVKATKSPVFASYPLTWYKYFNGKPTEVRCAAGTVRAATHGRLACGSAPALCAARPACFGCPRGVEAASQGPATEADPDTAVPNSQTIIKGGSCIDQANNDGATCGFASEYGQRIP